MSKKKGDGRGGVLVKETKKRALCQLKKMEGKEDSNPFRGNVKAKARPCALISHDPIVYCNILQHITVSLVAVESRREEKSEERVRLRE